MKWLEEFSAIAEDYISHIGEKPVAPTAETNKQLQHFQEDLQTHSLPVETVMDMLHRYGSPSTVKTTGGRYFGFVTGGSLPAARSAKMLGTIWDQNAGLYLMSPTAAVLEEVASKWLIEIFNLPKTAGVGFVTGATMANFTALAVARNELLKASGWDAEAKGLFGAPEITVITGDQVHVSVLKALNLVGFGRDRIVRVPADDQGRIISSEIPETKGPTLFCLQAGNVNSGAIDPIKEISVAKKYNTWIHIDGAFGLWAAASPSLRHLVDGIELADSWATDAHKWLNVPYDSGLVFVKDQVSLLGTTSAFAAYLPEFSKRDPFQFVPEMSREARGIPVWAALKSLGKNGLAAMIEKSCRQARRFAQGLEDAGYQVLNDVTLNQVLVSFGNSETSLAVLKKIQEDGVCWCGGTIWQGRTAMRISVSSWATTDEDVEISLSSIILAAKSIIRTNSTFKISL